MSLDRMVGLFGLAVVLALTARTLIVYRRTGKFPIRIHVADTAHDFIHAMIAVVFAMFFVNIVLMRLSGWLGMRGGIADASDIFYRYAVPFEAMNVAGYRQAGLAAAVLGLVVAALAQHQMGASWRIGIDREDETEMVRHGLYRHSRHPIYLGFMLIGVGLFFAMPSALSLVGMVQMITILMIQARLEEEFMLARHGSRYRAYLDSTRRWI